MHMQSPIGARFGNVDGAAPGRGRELAGVQALYSRFNQVNCDKLYITVPQIHQK